MRRAHTLFATVLIAGLPVWSAAQDLIVNGHFHTDIIGWQIVQGTGTQDWDPLDWQGDPGSGSLILTNTDPLTNQILVTGQCIPLSPSGTYEVGGHVRFPAGQPAGFGGIVVGWFDNTGCGGAPISTTNSPPVPSAPANVWVESFSSAITAPGGTVAVGVGPGLVKLVAGGSLVARFDRVRFGPTGTTPVSVQSFSVE